MANLTHDEISEKIRSSALLISLRLGNYNPVKTDKNESRKVSASHGITDKKLMKVQKHTLPTASVLEDIERLDTRIRAVVEKFTAPFARGIGLLPAAKFFDLRTAITPLFDERETMVKKLADEYAIYLDGAQRELNGAFNPSDYPLVTSVVEKFYAKLDSFPIGNPKDGRLGVLGDLAEQIQLAQEETLRDKFESVTPYLVTLMLKPLLHLSAVLQNKEAKLYDTTFTNVTDAADQAEHLNMVGDEQISNAVYGVKSDLIHDKEQVRDDDAIRAKMLEAANRLIESLDGAIPPPVQTKKDKAQAAEKAKSAPAAPVTITVIEPAAPEAAEAPSPDYPITDIEPVVPETPAPQVVEVVEPEPEAEETAEVPEAAAPVAEAQPETPVSTKLTEGFNPEAMLAKLGW